MNVKTLTRRWTLLLLLLALPGISQNVSAAEPAADGFRSVVTAENLDLANTAEFPANPELHPADAKALDPYWLSLLGIRGDRGVSRGGWQTGSTAEKNRHLRLAFKEALPIGTILGGDGALSYLKPEAPFPGDVTVDAQWVSVPLGDGSGRTHHAGESGHAGCDLAGEADLARTGVAERLRQSHRDR
jgi:hypothetical protein